MYHFWVPNDWTSSSVCRKIHSSHPRVLSYLGPMRQKERTMNISFLDFLAFALHYFWSKSYSPWTTYHSYMMSLASHVGYDLRHRTFTEQNTVHCTFGSIGDARCQMREFRSVVTPTYRWGGGMGFHGWRYVVCLTIHCQKVSGCV